MTTFDDVIVTDECTIQLKCHRKSVSERERCQEDYMWGGMSKQGATQLVMFSGIMYATFFFPKRSTKGQKHKRMLCGAFFAVCGLHIQGYCTISPHLTALHWHRNLRMYYTKQRQWTYSRSYLQTDYSREYTQ